MSDNDKKYETSNIDDIKALFDGRKTKEEPAPQNPLTKGKDEVVKEKSAVNGKKAENEKKRRNRTRAKTLFLNRAQLYTT